MIELKQINAHSKPVDDVAKLLETNITEGITEKEATKRLEIYGNNELIKEKGKTAWQIFIGQFKDFLKRYFLLCFAIFHKSHINQ